MRTFYLATSEDLDLATRGDFLMAMDTRSILFGGGVTRTCILALIRNRQSGHANARGAIFGRTPALPKVHTSACVSLGAEDPCGHVRSSTELADYGPLASSRMRVSNAGD